MAAYGDSPEAAPPKMGADDPYSDGAGEDEAKEGMHDEAKEGEDKGDSVEAVLPKAILAGKEFKVGDEVVLKITAMHDNEISVAYAPAKPGGKEEGGEAKMPASMEGGGEYD